MVDQSQQSIELTALILAGGQSSRMGQDKALIEIEGVPLLQRVYDVAQCCASAVFVVTPWPERYRTLLPSSCNLIREVYSDVAASQTPNAKYQTVPTRMGQTLENRVRGHGPLVGFAQGLVQVTTTWVLLLACDLPQLQAEPLQAGIERLGSLSDSAIALLPRHTKGWEPLCGFYRRRCLPNLESFIQQGERSFQKWLEQQSVDVLPISNPQLLFNCNTPADLQIVLAKE